MKILTIALIVLTMSGCTATDLLLGHGHKDTARSKPDSVIAIPIDECKDHSWNGSGFGHDNHKDCEEDTL